MGVCLRITLSDALCHHCNVFCSVLWLSTTNHLCKCSKIFHSSFYNRNFPCGKNKRNKENGINMEDETRIIDGKTKKNYSRFNVLMMILQMNTLIHFCKLSVTHSF